MDTSLLVSNIQDLQGLGGEGMLKASLLNAEKLCFNNVLKFQTVVELK